MGNAPDWCKYTDEDLKYARKKPWRLHQFIDAVRASETYGSDSLASYAYEQDDFDWDFLVNRDRDNTTCNLSQVDQRAKKADLFVW